MKILVIGGSGVIGSKAVEFLSKNHDVFFTYFKNKPPFANGYLLDIRQREDTVSIIEKLKPEVIIHTTAITNVDFCENNHHVADEINIKGTENVIVGCELTKSKLVYVSTSFVFDGRKKAYYENDEPSPATYYGITKNRSEELIKQSRLSFLILRTDQPYCWIEKWQHTNSVVRVIETLKKGNILNEIIDWYNSPTYVLDFVNTASKLVEEQKEGIYHVIGPDYINRFNWALVVAEIFNLDKNLIRPINSDTLKLPTKRFNPHLVNIKLGEIGINLSDVREGARKMRTDDGNNLSKIVAR